MRHIALKLLAVPFALTFVPACAGDITDGAPTFEAQTLSHHVREDGQLIQRQVWSHDASLRADMQEAAERIRLTSGVVIAVSPEALAPDAVEVRFTGEYVEHLAGRWTGAVLVGIDTPPESRPGYLVHEFMHMLGVNVHLDYGAGIMAPGSDGMQTITTADLELLCAVAICDWMQPEDGAL